MKTIGLIASVSYGEPLFEAALVAGLFLTILLFIGTLAGRAGALRFRGLSSIQRFFHRGRHRDRGPTLIPISVAAFLLAFGLVGSLLPFAFWVRTTLAIVAGSCTLSIAVLALKKVNDGLAESMKSETLIGSTCLVTLAIPAEGVGSIAYTAQGKRHTIPAREAAGAELPKGESVMVTDVRAGVAVVEAF